MSGWYYVKSGLVEDTNVGPISDSAFLEMAYSGELKASTLVLHQANTKGQWVQVSQIPAARKKIEQGLEDRRLAKEQKAQEKVAAKEAQKQAAIQQASQAAHQSPIAHLLLDGQPQNVIEKIYERVLQFLVANEEILYIAAQAKPLTIAPDCVVLTNMRFMIVKQTVLGAVSFQDFYWLDLGNSTVKEGVMFSAYAIGTIRGEVISLDYLPKPQARAIYRISQEKEQQMYELRRQRQMEESRAGAQSIVVNSSPGVVPIPATPVSVGEDPVEKLTKLKKMVDAGLITQAEYDETKRRILAAM